MKRLLPALILSQVWLGGLSLSTIAQPSLGRDLLQQVQQCTQTQILRNGFTLAKPLLEALETAGLECTFQIVVLTPEGTVRLDASDRLTALTKASGVRLPQPLASGQARVPLQVLPEEEVFTLPVQIGNQTQPFLLDTGASSSIVDAQTARQLRLKGRTIPDKLFAYMVVGKNCTGLQAQIQTLPPLRVGAAQVEKLTGLSLPSKAIPGGAAGVMGMDFLSGFDLVLDPQGAQVELLPRSQPIPTDIPLQGRLGVMTTQVYINGQGPFTFALDTGASQTVLSDRLAKQLDLTSEKTIDLTGFCGIDKGKPIQLRQLRVRSEQAEPIDAIILLDSKPLNLLGVDGILGQNFLNRYRQHWRFGNRNEMGFPETGSLELTPFKQF